MKTDPASGEAPGAPASAAEPVLVSACLLGEACRYDGAARAPLVSATASLRPIPICPERMAGMGVPRPPIERLDNGRVVRVADGVDVTAALEEAAARLIVLAREVGARRAVLKEYSPSCGVNALKRRGEVVSGRGLVAERLAAAGLELTTESQSGGHE